MRRAVTKRWLKAFAEDARRRRFPREKERWPGLGISSIDAYSVVAAILQRNMKQQAGPELQFWDVEDRRGREGAFETVVLGLVKLGAGGRVRTMAAGPFLILVWKAPH
jgi:hypothetical protein